MAIVPCVYFFVDRVSKDEAILKLHWGLLLIPGVLLGLGPPLVAATAFEFISAHCRRYPAAPI